MADFAALKKNPERLQFLSLELVSFDPDNSPYVSKGSISEGAASSDDDGIMLRPSRGQPQAWRKERAYYVYHSIVADLRWSEILEHVPAGKETRTELVELKSAPETAIARAVRPASLPTPDRLIEDLIPASVGSEDYSLSLSLCALLVIHYPETMTMNDWFEVGCLYRARDTVGDLLKAVEIFTIALRHPADDDMSSVVGDCYEMHGDALLVLGLYQLALPSLDKAVQLIKSEPVLWKLRGFVKDQLGDGAGAIENYRESLRLKPEYAPSACNLAHSQHSSGRLDEALVSYTAAIMLMRRAPVSSYESDPTLHARTLLRRGLVFAQTRQARKAAEDWIASFEMFDSFPRLNRYLASMNCEDDVLASIREVPVCPALMVLRGRVENFKSERQFEECDKERRTGFASLVPFSCQAKTHGQRSLQLFVSFLVE